MTEPTALFCDVGGVLLTNGWDREGRRRVIEEFKLDWDEFEGQHDLLSSSLDSGRITLDTYLERTIFFRKQSFTREAVKQAIFAQSRAFPENLALVERIAARQRYFLATLNNESLELNLYRIERFGLRRLFSVFFSSCFLGVLKPDPAIYHLALKMTQRRAEDCLFVDDRPGNVEAARQCGMQAIQYENIAQLERDLRAAGVKF